MPSHRALLISSTYADSGEGHSIRDIKSGPGDRTLSATGGLIVIASAGFLGSGRAVVRTQHTLFQRELGRKGRKYLRSVLDPLTVPLGLSSAAIPAQYRIASWCSTLNPCAGEQRGKSALRRTGSRRLNMRRSEPSAYCSFCTATDMVPLRRNARTTGQNPPSQFHAAAQVGPFPPLVPYQRSTYVLCRECRENAE
jgi:hypothetical protein